MPVIVDSREPERIKKILKFQGLKFTVQQLETGDVICKSDKNKDVEVVIERKRIDDLVSSYVEKRMETQFSRLSKKKFAVLVVTGDLKAVAKKFPFKIMPNFVSEVISKAVIQYNFRSVVWLLKGEDDVNAEGFASVVKMINLVVKDQLDQVPERNIKVASDARVDTLKKLFGLSSVICVELLKKHGSVINILKLSDGQFLGIPGIGPAHLKRIRFILNSEFREKKKVKPVVQAKIKASGEKCKICGANMEVKKLSTGINVSICPEFPHSR